MNKKTIGLALSILMALGVTACSSGGGSDSSTDKRNTATDRIGDFNKNNSNNGNNSNKNPEVAHAATTYFADKPTSATYAFVTDPAKQAELKAAIDNRTGSCDRSLDVYCVAINPTRRPTGPRTFVQVPAQPEGAVLLTQKASYAGFAVVREGTDRIVAQDRPVNSFISVVYTPTTDMAAVVDAQYTGNVAYTTHNSAKLDMGKLTLNVVGSTVNGVIQNDAHTQRLVTLENGNISASGNGVVFNGGAVFHSEGLNIPERRNPLNNLYSDFYGTYKGSFAGANAENVVGTFESDSIGKDISVQGAFVGAK